MAEAIPDLVLITGPLLLGYMFNWFLYGILTVQVYVYYLSFPNDGKLHKCLVYGIYFMDTIQTCLTTHNAFHFLAYGWGDVRVLADPGWSWIAVPLFSGLVSATVQLFFAWRIWVLGRSYSLTGLIIIIALAQGICALVSGIKFAILNDVTQIASLFPTATVWLGGSALCDLIITCSMVYFLANASTGFRHTDSIITRLIRMTVETGSVTTVAAITELILFLVYQTNNLHMIPAICLAKLYSNTLLATLNQRSATFANSRESGNQVSSHQQATWKGNGTVAPTGQGIHITTVREIAHDDLALYPMPNSKPNAAVSFSKSFPHSDDDDDEVSKASAGADSAYFVKAKDLESGR